MYIHLEVRTPAAGTVEVVDRLGTDYIAVVVGEPMAVRTASGVEDTPVVDRIESGVDTSQDRHISSQAAIAAYSQGLVHWLATLVLPADYVAIQDWVNSYHTDFYCPYIRNLFLS